MLRGAQCPNGVSDPQQTHHEMSDASKEFEANDLSNPIRRLQLINAEKVSFEKKNRHKSKEMKLIGSANKNPFKSIKSNKFLIMYRGH